MTTFDTYGNQLEHEARRTIRTVALIVAVAWIVRWIARRI